MIEQQVHDRKDQHKCEEDELKRLQRIDPKFLHLQQQHRQQRDVTRICTISYRKSSEVVQKSSWSCLPEPSKRILMLLQLSRSGCFLSIRDSNHWGVNAIVCKFTHFRAKFPAPTQQANKHNNPTSGFPTRGIFLSNCKTEHLYFKSCPTSKECRTVAHSVSLFTYQKLISVINSKKMVCIFFEFQIDCVYVHKEYQIWLDSIKELKLILMYRISDDLS